MGMQWIYNEWPPDRSDSSPFYPWAEDVLRPDSLQQFLHPGAPPWRSPVPFALGGGRGSPEASRGRPPASSPE